MYLRIIIAQETENDYIFLKRSRKNGREKDYVGLRRWYVNKYAGCTHAKSRRKDGIEVNIFATAASDADNKLAEEKPDVLMLGPQVRYLEGQFKKDLDIPVDVINMQDYGLMNGEKVLKASLKAIADGKQGEEA